ncbi:MAG: hypothetical protein EOP49_46785 [Sphingobacteriales bacterium]|nr:MAG: hypothetical protein EOP49_46785 [Sphingobacteriales bacterium]
MTSGGCSIASAAGKLTVGSYCTPVHTSAEATTYYVNSFTTTGGATNISNTNTGYSTAGYGNFTNLSASQILGGTVNFSTVTGQSATSDFGMAIWIDFNHNGTFDTTERVFVTSAYTISPSGSFVIPANATLGNTRMRIMVDYLNSAPSNPCSYSNDAEVEDYTFNVLAQPGCSGTPTAGTITASTQSLCVSGTVTFTATGYSNAAGLSLQWYNNSGAISGANAATYTTPVLNASDVYYLRVTCDATSTFADTNTLAVTVNNPSASVTDGTRCGTGTVTLSATPSSGATVDWYAAASGGASLATGNTFTTPSISATTTYYAEASTGTGGSVGQEESHISLLLDERYVKGV